MLKYVACLASSLDGRINPQLGTYQRMGTDADIAHLKARRDECDALVMGSATFRAWPYEHRGHRDHHRPLHIVLTRGHDLIQAIPPDSPIFQGESMPAFWVLTQKLPSEALKQQYPQSIRWFLFPHQEEPQAQIFALSQQLQTNGYKNILVEGGGQVLRLFIEARAIDSMYLTLCPLLLGEGTLPPLIGGEAFSLNKAPRTRILSLYQEGDELYLHLKLQYCESNYY